MCRLLLIILLFLPTISFAENVNFAGTVSTSCSFGSFQQGTLNSTIMNGKYVLESGWSSLNDAASTDISYDGNPTITIDAISGWVTAPQNVPLFSDLDTGVGFLHHGQTSVANTIAATTAGAAYFEHGSKSFNLNSTYGNIDTIHVKMRAVADSPWPTGSYLANTVISCQ